VGAAALVGDLIRRQKLERLRLIAAAPTGASPATFSDTGITTA
jgi:hypothetical protein